MYYHQGTVKKVMSEFRRTHHDSWTEHKQKFTDDQLAVLTDLLVSPSYYAQLFELCKLLSNGIIAKVLKMNEFLYCIAQAL